MSPQPVSRHDVAWPIAGPGREGPAAALRIVAPARPRGPVLLAVPGGGMSARYFDLDAPGYSMAERLAALGFVVVGVDLPGVGAATPLVDDAEAHPDHLADSLAAIARSLLGALRTGAATPNLGPLPGACAHGLAHSMGSMLMLLAQARHRCFETLGLLGWSGRGLAGALTPEEVSFVDRPDELRGQLARLAHARFGTALAAPLTRSRASSADDEASAGSAALAAASCPLLGQPGLFAMVPGSHAAEQAAITVPVWCGVGERDIVGDPRAIAGDLPNAEVETIVLAGAGHNAVVAANRHDLTDAYADWLGRHNDRER